METINDTKPIDAAAEYPSLSARIQSSVVDFMVVFAMLYYATELMDKYEDAPDWVRIGLFLTGWLLYEPLCTTLGCTLGNFVKGIRVRRASDHSRRIHFFAALFRFIMKTWLGWVSFLTIHSDPQRRAIHDLVAGSVVVRKRKLR